MQSPPACLSVQIRLLLDSSTVQPLLWKDTSKDHTMALLQVSYSTQYLLQLFVAHLYLQLVYSSPKAPGSMMAGVKSLLFSVPSTVIGT